MVLGVCAMDKKTGGKPMQEILKRLRSTGNFDIIVFGDDCILNRAVEEWPVVDCLIAFYSDGFPLDKAEAYNELRKPFLINSLREQRWLQDRRKMYSLLAKLGTLPRHVICSREPTDDPVFDWPVVRDDKDFHEDCDHINVHGVTIRKPFVEKPANGDDHNVRIYYPSNAGGGTKYLFRKVGDKSAEFHPDQNNVRTDGSYIYESFVKSGGTDIKVYTVGPDYAHAEARRSPTVDGRVHRDADGKEVRYPVLLSAEEKEMARMVVLEFNQNVCGLDILRTPAGRSYVIDVNGWSAVKKGKKYYDDTALILHAMCMAACGLQQHWRHEADPDRPLSQEPSATPSNPLVGTPLLQGPQAPVEELRCVLIVARHGDRTPKQKMKLRCSYPQLLELHRKWSANPRKEAKLKSPTQLGEMLAAVKQLADSALQEARSWRENSSTEMLATTPPGQETFPRPPRKASGSDVEETLSQLVLIQKVLGEGGQFSGINRKVQLKPTAWKEGAGGKKEATELLVVLKYGGVLTPAGRMQAEALGHEIRERLYPANDNGGLLRLHSTYRHDLKIYCSDEGRVQISAAAFARGLLDLEGALTPILVSMVHKDTRMLDDTPPGVDVEVRTARKILHSFILGEDDEASECPDDEPAASVSRCGDAEGMPENPRELLNKIVECMEQLTDELWQLALSEISEIAEEQLRQSHQSQDGASQSRQSSTMAAAALSGDAGVDETMRSASPGPAPDVQRLTDVVEEAGAEAVVGELAQANVPFHMMTAGKATMWTNEDNRAPRAPESSPQSDGARSGPTPIPHQTPYGGESPVMIHMRWDRLLRQLRDPQKQTWDLSKVPDVLDSVKYDVIHNSHMRLTALNDLHRVTTRLGKAVVANEYGIAAQRRLRVGATISYPLVLKLLCDLTKNCIVDAARPAHLPPAGARGAWAKQVVAAEAPAAGPAQLTHRSGTAAVWSGAGALASPLALAGSGGASPPKREGTDPEKTTVSRHGSAAGLDRSQRDAAIQHALEGSGRVDKGDKGRRGSAVEELHRKSIQMLSQPPPPPEGQESRDGSPIPKPPVDIGTGPRAALDAAAVRVEEEEEVAVRLDPVAAGESGIRSSQRSVVTRVYFTSESHIYGLMNVLRTCPMAAGAEAGSDRLVSEEAEQALRDGPSYDYLSHVVIRVFEVMQPRDSAARMTDDQRFRVEVDFSAGARDDVPQPDDRHPEPLRERHRMSTPSLGLATTQRLLRSCLRSPPCIAGAWDEMTSGDDKDSYSVGHDMRAHNAVKAKNQKDASSESPRTGLSGLSVCPGSGNATPTATPRMATTPVARSTTPPVSGGALPSSTGGGGGARPPLGAPAERRPLPASGSS